MNRSVSQHSQGLEFKSEDCTLHYILSKSFWPTMMSV